MTKLYKICLVALLLIFAQADIVLILNYSIDLDTNLTNTKDTITSFMNTYVSNLENGQVTTKYMDNTNTLQLNTIKFAIQDGNIESAMDNFNKLTKALKSVKGYPNMLNQDTQKIQKDITSGYKLYVYICKEKLSFENKIYYKIAKTYSNVVTKVYLKIKLKI